jgi:hypothetical protein
MLTGLAQKGSDQVQELKILLLQMVCRRRRGRIYPIQVIKRNVVSPYLSRAREG